MSFILSSIMPTKLFAVTGSLLHPQTDILSTAGPVAGIGLLHPATCYVSSNDNGGEGGEIVTNKLFQQRLFLRRIEAASQQKDAVALQQLTLEIGKANLGSEAAIVSIRLIEASQALDTSMEQFNAIWLFPYDILRELEPDEQIKVYELLVVTARDMTDRSFGANMAHSISSHLAEAGLGTAASPLFKLLCQAIHGRGFGTDIISYVLITEDMAKAGLKEDTLECYELLTRMVETIKERDLFLIVFIQLIDADLGDSAEPLYDQLLKHGRTLKLSPRTLPIIATNFSLVGLNNRAVALFEEAITASSNAELFDDVLGTASGLTHDLKRGDGAAPIFQDLVTAAHVIKPAALRTLFLALVKKEIRRFGFEEIVQVPVY